MRRWGSACIVLLGCAASAGCEFSTDVQEARITRSESRPLDAEHRVHTEVSNGAGRVWITPINEEDAAGVEVATFSDVGELRAGPVAGGIEICADAQPDARRSTVRLENGRRLAVSYGCSRSYEPVAGSVTQTERIDEARASSASL